MNKKKCFWFLPETLQTFKSCKVCLAIVLFLFCSPYLFAQSPIINYAHYVIDTLTSPYMDGRGYVDSGEWKAATFIRNEFKKDSLRTFKNSHFQTDVFNVNVFPGKMKVT